MYDSLRAVGRPVIGDEYLAPDGMMSEKLLRFRDAGSHGLGLVQARHEYRELEHVEVRRRWGRCRSLLDAPHVACGRGVVMRPSHLCVPRRACWTCCLLARWKSYRAQ